ncbi:hypothetical protein [Herbaspirillum seropedicae]|uniref:hypothetical protein n=1 Tax=Herbaspirillum seropedicae TaxID=964 RepID=UPI002865D0FD|nr:hypothetical protein [Herbaspirillum seropedicae]MDR6393760.1 hypothetical protein [Herbaspirillum seropedicae]
MNYLQPFNQTPLTGEQRAAGTDTFLAALGIVVKETEPLFLFAGAPSSEVRISGANRLPLSFKDSLVVRGDASRAQIVQAIGDAAQPSLESILRLDPNARVGFRGSLVDGLKNETKLGMNGERVAFDGIVATKDGKPYTGPQGYDADFFVVSDELAAQFAKKTFFRNIATLDGTVKDAIQEFGNAMQRNPILGGMKTELPSFRIYTTAEMAKKSGSQYYFLQVGK